jgi:3-methyladenine DNA glycosylase/8-oxoguanine DNA glycosylase
MPTKITLPVPEGFRLRSVVYSHGWYDLPPFEWDERSLTLRTAVHLDSAPIDLTFRQDKDRLSIACSSTVRAAKRAELKQVASRMLGLGLQLSAFYELAGKRFSWAKTLGVGRFLRGGSAFEDVVKMLATTNCSWALTKVMIGRMIDALGESTPDGRRAFPTAKRLAEQDLAFFRNDVRAGYRSEYFQTLARRVASGVVDVEAWPNHSGNVQSLAVQIRAEKGCGPYVVENLCRLFGRFDGLGIDSWCRKKFAEIHGPVDGDVDAAIRAKYRRFGCWQGLALWLDLTKDWHVKE